MNATVERQTWKPIEANNTVVRIERSPMCAGRSAPEWGMVGARLRAHGGRGLEKIELISG